MEDKNLVCKDCGNEFAQTVGSLKRNLKIMERMVKTSLNCFLFMLSIIFVLIATFFTIIASSFTKVSETLLEMYEEETIL